MSDDEKSEGGRLNIGENENDEDDRLVETEP